MDRDESKRLLREAEEGLDGHVASGVEYGLMWDDIVNAAEQGDVAWLAKFHAAWRAQQMVVDERDGDRLAQHPISYVPLPEDRIEEYDESTFVQLSDFAVSELGSILFGIENLFPEVVDGESARAVELGIIGVWDYLWEKHSEDWFK